MDKCAAVLTIHKPAKMDRRGRAAIAKWLHRQADHFSRYGTRYSETRFTARYLYR